jgi:hypothetical protein
VHLKVRSRVPRLREHVTRVQELQQRVSQVRPYLPDGLYEQYRRWSAFVGRVQLKVIRQVATGVFRPWSELDDGAPDLPLRDLASRILSAEEIEALWAGRVTSLGVYRPLKPVVDVAERGLLDLIRVVLSGLARRVIGGSRLTPRRNLTPRPGPEPCFRP